MYALFRRNFSVLGKRCSIYPNLLKRKEVNPREARCKSFEGHLGSKVLKGIWVQKL
jgi:hypothetical protein